MTKAELVVVLSDKTGIDKDIILNTLETYFDTVKETLTKGEGVYVRGFGSFENKKRAEKKARNISDNSTVIVPAHYIPSFKPAKEFMLDIKEKVKA